MSRFTKHRDAWIGCERCALCRHRYKTVLARGSVPADILFVGEAPGDSEDVLGRPFVGPAGHELDKMIEEAGLDSYRLAFTNLVACIPNLPAPRVVNIKREKCDVRICRGTPWGNPFFIGRDGDRTEVIDKYRAWIEKQPSLLLSIEQLAGQKLGCFCKPKACHGDVIVDLFEQIVSQRKHKRPPDWAIEACKDRLIEFHQICKPKIIVCVGELSATWTPKILGKRKYVNIIHPAAILRMNQSQKGLAIQRTIETLQEVKV